MSAARRAGSRDALLLTGATGLLGMRIAERLLATEPDLRIFALCRRPIAGRSLVSRLGMHPARAVAVYGDVRQGGLGLAPDVRSRLAAEVSTVVHCAADTKFSRPLDEARAVNTAGTRYTLELAGEWGVERFVHVSTAFVAGRRSGAVPELELDAVAGFVNAYEQSKHEAETLVRAAALPWTIVRPSTIACDDVEGAVSQYNAVHRALRVFHAGLAALMPGAEETPVDLVTTSYVAEGVARLTRASGATRGTYHLCAGAGALPLGELLDRAHALWSRSAEWRLRGTARPALADLATYRLFEQSVQETGDVRLATLTRSLSHFVPQLALPKRFATNAADDALGFAAPPVRAFFESMLEYLLATRWGAASRSAA